jgi:hypothetical protein
MMDEKKYIGVKTVYAYPMSKEIALVRDLIRTPEKTVEEKGYYVRYEDGYESWSPKTVFEKAYRESKGLSIGMAFEALKRGKQIRLGGTFFKPKFNDLYDKFCLSNAQLLSEDWEIVD